MRDDANERWWWLEMKEGDERWKMMMSDERWERKKEIHDNNEIWEIVMTVVKVKKGSKSDKEGCWKWGWLWWWRLIVSFLERTF